MTLRFVRLFSAVPRAVAAPVAALALAVTACVSAPRPARRSGPRASGSRCPW